MVYGRYNELVNGVYKQTYNWGANIFDPVALFLWRISRGFPGPTCWVTSFHITKRGPKKDT